MLPRAPRAKSPAMKSLFRASERYGSNCSIALVAGLIAVRALLLSSRRGRGFGEFFTATGRRIGNIIVVERGVIPIRRPSFSLQFYVLVKSKKGRLCRISFGALSCLAFLCGLWWPPGGAAYFGLTIRSMGNATVSCCNPMTLQGRDTHPYKPNLPRCPKRVD